MIEIQTAEQLARQSCRSCENGEGAYPADRVAAQLAQLPGWELTHGGKRIAKRWRVKNFLAGLSFFEAIGVVAEAEAHHPDLHLENYRDVTITMWTHTLDGLSENDFILAAKIDQIAQGR